MLVTLLPDDTNNKSIKKLNRLYNLIKSINWSYKHAYLIIIKMRKFIINSKIINKINIIFLGKCLHIYNNCIIYYKKDIMSNWVRL